MPSISEKASNQPKYDLPIFVNYTDGGIHFIVTPPETKKNELFWRYIPEVLKRAGSTNNLQLIFMGDIASLSSKIKKPPLEEMEQKIEPKYDQEIISFVRIDPTVNSILSEVFNHPKNYEFDYKRIDEENGATKNFLLDIFNKMFILGDGFKPSAVEMQQFDFIKNFYDIISGDVMNIGIRLTHDFFASYSLNIVQTTQLIENMMTDLHSKKVDPRVLIMLNAVVLAGAKTFDAL